MQIEVTRRWFLGAVAASALALAAPVSAATKAGKTISVYCYKLKVPWDLSTQWMEEKHPILKTDAKMADPQSSGVVVFSDDGTEMWVLYERRSGKDH